MPVISVIVPIYNTEFFLERCIDSILAQTFTDFELILVDDGSTDNCGKICDEYAEKDKRIRVLHKKNGGVASARNAGIDSSRGQWIAFVDSDDEIDSDYLKYLLNAAKNNNVKIAFCGLQRIKVKEEIHSHFDGNVIVIHPSEVFSYSASEYDLIPFASSIAKLFSKQIFAELRFPEQYRIGEDSITVQKALLTVDSIACVLEKKYYYYQNATSVMHEKWSSKKMDEILVCEEQLILLNNNGWNIAYERQSSFLLSLYLRNFYAPKKFLDMIRYNPFISIKCRRFIIRNKKRLNLSFPSHKQHYFVAYPVLLLARKIKNLITGIRK